jgi:hypothetical protein
MNSEKIFRIVSPIWQQIFHQLDSITDTETAARAAKRACDAVEKTLCEAHNVPRYERPSR